MTSLERSQKEADSARSKSSDRKLIKIKKRLMPMDIFTDAKVNMGEVQLPDAASSRSKERRTNRHMPTLVEVNDS